MLKQSALSKKHYFLIAIFLIIAILIGMSISNSSLLQGRFRAPGPSFESGIFTIAPDSPIGPASLSDDSLVLSMDIINPIDAVDPIYIADGLGLLLELRAFSNSNDTDEHMFGMPFSFERDGIRYPSALFSYLSDRETIATFHVPIPEDLGGVWRLEPGESTNIKIYAHTYNLLDETEFVDDNLIFSLQHAPREGITGHELQF
jgi:hypothetical protein